VNVSRKDTVIYDIPYNFKVDDDLSANSGEPGVEGALLAALMNDISDWPDLFAEENMYDPAQNFDAGAFMLKRIMERLTPNDRSIRKIAILYNNINAAAVNDYGARVDYFVRTLRSDWLSAPAASRVGTP